MINLPYDYGYEPYDYFVHLRPLLRQWAQSAAEPAPRVVRAEPLLVMLAALVAYKIYFLWPHVVACAVAFYTIKCLLLKRVLTLLTCDNSLFSSKDAHVALFARE